MCTFKLYGNMFGAVQTCKPFEKSWNAYMVLLPNISHRAREKYS